MGHTAEGPRRRPPEPSLRPLPVDRSAVSRRAPGAAGIALAVATLASMTMGPTPGAGAQDDVPRSGAAPESGEILFEEAYYLEVALADPERAARIYRRLEQSESLPSALRVLTRLRLGICQHRLGRDSESRASFQRVLDEHPDELDAVRIAREYLGGGPAGDPVRFMPPDVLLYAEIVRPAQHVRALSEILQGTPFQNPVDYYVAALSASTDGNGGAGKEIAHLPPLPRPVREASAVLNEALLRDLQRIEAVAVGILPSFPRDGSFLLAILPGESDIVSGIAQWAIAMREAPVAGTVQRLPIFRLAEEQGETGLHAAVGDALGGDVILLGQPRTVVESAVDRYALGRSSLADNAKFAGRPAGRPDNLVFAYISPDHLAASLLADIAAADRAPRERMLRALGSGSVDDIRLTVSHSPSLDLLRVVLAARISSAEFAAWEAFATPPLDDALLWTIPGDALAYFATAADASARRVAAGVEIGAAFVDLLEPAARLEAERNLAALRRAITEGAGRALLERLDGLAVAIAPALRDSLPASLQVVLRVRGDDAAARVEDAIGAVLETTAGTPASRRFFDETITAGGRTLEVRTVEPLPGIRLRCLRLADLFVISFAERVLVEAHRSWRAVGELPPGGDGAKLLHARPARIQEELRQRGGADPAGLGPLSRALLDEIDTLRITTREGDDGVSLEIVVPQIKGVLRRILTRLPRLR